MSISVNSQEVVLSVGRFKKNMNVNIEKTLMKTANYGIQIILTRTQKGQGLNGAFRPYSPQYLKWKTQKYGSISRTPNLQLTNEMLGAIAPTKVSPKTVRLGFTRLGAGTAVSKIGPAKKAWYNQVAGRVLRPFFGFTKPEIKRLTQFFKDNATKQRIGRR